MRAAVLVEVGDLMSGCMVVVDGGRWRWLEATAAARRMAAVVVVVVVVKVAAVEAFAMGLARRTAVDEVGDALLVNEVMVLRRLRVANPQPVLELGRHGVDPRVTDSGGCRTVDFDDDTQHLCHRHDTDGSIKSQS